MKKWRFVALLIVVLIIFATVLAACGGGEVSDTSTTSGADLTADSLDTKYKGTSLGFGAFWVILAVGAGFGAAYGLGMLRKKDEYDGDAGPRVGRVPRLVISSLIVLIVLGLAFPLFGYVVVDAGEVGVQIRQGDAVAQLNPGPHFITPFLDRVVIFSTRPFTYITMGDPVAQGEEEYKDFAVDVITSDGVQALIKYTIQGQLRPEDAIMVYEDYGTLINAIEQRVKNPARVLVRGSLQGFSSSSLAGSIDSVQEEVSVGVGEEMDAGGLEMIFFGFRKPTIGINGDWEQELNATAVAIQTEKKETENTKVKTQLANQAIETAKGEAGADLAKKNADAEAAAYKIKTAADADLYRAQQDAEATKTKADARAYQLEVEAAAEAAANELVAASISGDLIEYLQWTETWDGALPVWMTGGSSAEGGPIITVPVDQP